MTPNLRRKRSGGSLQDGNHIPRSTPSAVGESAACGLNLSLSEPTPDSGLVARILLTVTRVTAKGDRRHRQKLLRRRDSNRL